MEAASGCRPVVVERLYASTAGSRHAWYGPQRLADAGFDLARLYRGALVTRGRDAAEDRDARVRALEGFADAAGKPALAVALAQARTGPVEGRTRALHVLGALARRSGSDPCASEPDGWFGMHFSSGDEREIRPLDATCHTQLSSGERTELVRALAPLAADHDPEIREQAARTLGEVAAAASEVTLTALLSDSFQPQGATICTSSGNDPNRCRPYWPVREAARSALDRIREIKRRSP